MSGNYALGIIAIVAVCLAQVLRIYRLKMIVYKNGFISNRTLSRSIGISYLANLILPFRLGEIIRIFYLKKKQFGLFPTIVSVFLERLMDSILITIIFGIYFYSREENFRSYFQFFFLVTIGFVLVFYIAIKPKKEKLKILNWFSEEVQIKLNNSIFQMYLVVKNFKLNFKLILVSSLVINFGIFVSILLFSRAIDNDPIEIVEILIFNLSNSITVAMVQLAALSNQGFPVLLYLLTPILVLLVPSYHEMKSLKFNASKNELDALRNIVIPEKRSQKNDIYIKDSVSRIATFGKNGLSQIQTETLKGQKLIEVLQGGASGDQVFLIEGDEGYKVRKSAMASRKHFLAEQNYWMRTNASLLPIVKTSDLVITSNAAYFDMEYLGVELNVFNKMHSTSLDESKRLLNNLLNSLQLGSFDSNQPVERSTYAALYREKLINCFGVLKRNNLEDLLTIDLIHCGISLHRATLQEVLYFLSRTDLPTHESWKMHGDLTVSNMLMKDGNIVLIDPNPVQPFRHSTVDFGKLLQSFKCGYEFDFKNPQIFGSGPDTKIISTRSILYANLENHLYTWIETHTGRENLRHSQVQLLLHLIRIFPYAQNPDQLIWLIVQMRIIFTELNSGYLDF